MRTLISVALFSLVVLSGCAETSSIYRQSRISGQDPVAIVTDAKQRVLLSQIVGHSGDGKGTAAIRKYCAEPSPDAFTVLAQAASGGASLGLDKDAKSLNAALQAAFSSSESGTTIPRTQTINMLREMMFRTCERYLSGAISDIEMPIVAIRDQRVMVSILAIEQLTGAVTPKPVIISTTGSASTGLDSTEAMKLLAKARDNLTAADTALASAKTERATADSGAGAGGCTQIEKDETDGKKPDAAKLKACTDSKAKLGKAQEAYDGAKAFYESQSKLATTGQGVSNATTSTGAVTDPKDWSFAQAQAVQNVASTVKEIVHETFDQDETQFFCFKQIGDPQAARNMQKALGSGEAIERVVDEVKAECLAYLMTRVRVDRGKLEDEARRYGLNAATYENAIRAGRTAAEQKDQSLAARIAACGLETAKYNALVKAMQADDALKSEVVALQTAKGKDTNALARFVQNLTDIDRPHFEALVTTHCGS